MGNPQDLPREDTRPPDYVKGQWFGTVPHTRVFVQARNSRGVFASLADGVLLDQSGEDFTDPNFGFAEWRGVLTDGFGRWVYRYRWSVASDVEGTCNFLLAINHFTEPWNLQASLQLFSPDLATVKSMTVGQVNPPGEVVGQATKFDVFEWATPSERWPDVHFTEVF